MIFKTIIGLVLLAFLANITIGSPYRRREFSSRKNHLSTTPSWSATKSVEAETVKEPEEVNEYKVIFEARRNARHMSYPRVSDAVHTRSFARKTRISPFAGNDDTIRESYNNPSRSHISTGRSLAKSPQHSLSKASTAHKIIPQEEPEYLY